MARIGAERSQHQRDGPVRDGVADSRGQPARSDKNEYSMGGTSYGSHTTSASDSGYGQLRESSTRPAGGGSLQRPLRVCLLSPSHTLNSFLFNQFGDCEGAMLRPGNVHSADGWQEVLEPVVVRYLIAAVRLLFRADAAFAKPEIYEYLETRQIGYAIRLPANEVLQREVAHLLVRPTEWPSRKPIVSYHDFTYRSQSWNVSRRVVAKSLP